MLFWLFETEIQDLKDTQSDLKEEKIDNMMFTLVAIQNMLLDYSIANEEMTSWGIQLKWQKIDFTEGTYSLDELLNNLALAEHEDIQEETDSRWFRPLVKKKVRKNNSTWKTTDDSHDPGKDFATVGLRVMSPTNFGWGDWGIPNGDERNAFKHRQKILKEHYTGFCKHRPAAWIRT